MKIKIYDLWRLITGNFFGTSNNIFHRFIVKFNSIKKQKMDYITHEIIHIKYFSKLAYHTLKKHIIR